MAIVSLLLCGALLVYWWRSNHGHVDQFSLGATGQTQSHFLSQSGRVAITVHENGSADIRTQTKFYEFRQFIGYFLIIPGLWLAIAVRGWLPRPGGRPKAAR